MIWEWANEAGVRASSFSSGIILWDEHHAWLRAKLADSDCTMFIMESPSGPIGQVRVERHDDAADIDISVAKESRSLGYGSGLIEVAVRKYLAETDVHYIDAFIQPENEGSIRAFENAGFELPGATTVRGQAALHYRRHRHANR